MTSGGVKYDAAVAMRARAAEVARLRVLLARLEWASSDYDLVTAEDRPCCPACGRLQRDGHNPAGCELAAELHGSEAVRTA